MLVTNALRILAFAQMLHAQSMVDAVDAFHNSRYVQARDMFEKLAAASPNDVTARTFLALSRAATGGCAEARGDLQQQLDKNPDPTLRRFSGLALVQCALAANRLEEAWPVLGQLQKSFPSDADVLYETTKAHMKAWNDAVFQMYQKAPASFRVNQLSGEIFETQGRYHEAAGEYRKAIEKILRP